jgi:hypothetical protein
MAHQSYYTPQAITIAHRAEPLAQAKAILCR